MAALRPAVLTMVSLEVQPLRSSFGKVFMGAAGGGEDLPSDDQFNRTSFLSHFEGANNGVNNVFDDSSASNHTVTANANITQGSFSPFSRPDGEWGVAFDNTGDYLDANDGPTWGTGAFTIECFVFLTVLGADQVIFDARPDGTNGLYPMVALASDNKLNLHVDGAYRITSSGTLSANTWYHVAICRSGTSTKMFLDGTQVGSTYSDSNDYVDSGRMRVGGRRDYSNSTGLNGIISNVRVVNSALYTSNFTAPTGKLTAVTDTKLLTCQSNRFVDNSASPLTITPAGDPAVTAFGPFLTRRVYDPAVNGASMQGFATTAGDSVQIAQTTDTNLTGDFTVECWVYFNGLDGSHGLLAKVNPSDNAVGFIFYAQDSSQSNGFTFQIRNNGSTSGIANIASGVFATTGQWYHVAACRTGTTVSMFVNGVRHATGTTSNNGTISSITSIGNYYSSSNARYVKGYICDARIINGTAAYDGATYTIPTAPLTAVTNTKLLLNMADGQAIDSTAQDNIKLEAGAKLSTAQYKFGTSSILFDAEADNRASFKTKPFGTGDFTIEGFFRKVAEKDNNDAIWDSRGVGQSGAGYFTLVDETRSNYTREIYYYNGQAQFRCGSASALSLNTWYHIAVCRSGTSLKVFLDGTQVGSTFSDSTEYINDHFSIGNFGDNYSLARGWDGYVDEFRISYMARYTSNFTAPTEPFADKGR